MSYTDNNHHQMDFSVICRADVETDRRCMHPSFNTVLWSVFEQMCMCVSVRQLLMFWTQQHINRRNELSASGLNEHTAFVLKLLLTLNHHVLLHSWFISAGFQLYCPLFSSSLHYFNLVSYSHIFHVFAAASRHLSQ